MKNVDISILSFFKRVLVNMKSMNRPGVTEILEGVSMKRMDGQSAKKMKMQLKWIKC